MLEPDAGKRLFGVVVALGALTFAGCSGTNRSRPAHPATPRSAVASPLPARSITGYGSRTDSLDAVDPRAVVGKRIAIDPGHGGYFKGSIGIAGLTEAEVNLGVALHLRDLLVARGAEVFLTRDTDRDFLTRADSTLRSDLNRRSELANAFRPDVFLSIHHNADPRGAHDRNETQTYYQLGDDGPAFELGEDVHASLARNLGIEIARLLPGNFHVVRSSVAPALLSEASYLTHPDVEALLRTPRAQQLEAEALYLGLARWFARQRPELVDVVVVGAPGDLDTVLSVGRPLVAGRIEGTSDEVSVWFDGTPAPVERVQDRFWAQPTAPLAAGQHEVVLRARLSTEGSARAVRRRFWIHKGAPTSITHAARVLVAPRCEPLVVVRSEALDRDGLRYADPLELHLEVLGEPGIHPRDTTVAFRDGRADVDLRCRPGRTVPEQVRLRATVRVPGEAKPVGTATLSASTPVASSAPPTRHAFLRVAPADTLLRDAPGTADPPAGTHWLSRTGLAELRTNAAGVSVLPRIAGYRPVGADTLWPPRVTPLAGGALLGRRIVLDPEGGGEDDAGMGPRGTRASALNLEVARALGGMLRAAGAEVTLTRSGDRAVPEMDRVAVSEAFRAERYLRIGHANTTPIAGHYWSSAGGRHWASRVASAAATMGLDSVQSGESAKYPITQVAAVALYASLARVDSSEATLSSPGRLRREAYALYLALARDFGATADWPIDSLQVRDADGRPVAGAPVTFGAALTLATDASGTVRFARTEPGPIEIVIDDPRVKARIVLLESDRGRTLTGAR